MMDSMEPINITECEEKLRNLNVFVGFDGFIDEIIGVIKERTNQNDYALFKTISEFSDHTKSKAGISADMEIIRKEMKIGGNAPIMANALSGFGIKTTCVGAMGYPNISEVFEKMSPLCEKISVCNSGHAYALEFNDGKLMLADLIQLEELTWERIKTCVGIDKLIKLIKKSDMLALVNWSLAYTVSEIWQGIYNEVLPSINDALKPKKTVFFDLADPSKRLKEDIKSVLGLISNYSKYLNVVLGLNENEALEVYSALFDKSINGEIPLEDIGSQIFDSMRIETLIIHPLDCCVVVNKTGIVKQHGKLVQNPKITTGGGDNFNAGYCLGRLLGFIESDCLTLAMNSSSFYVKNAYSPSLKELLQY